MIFFSTIPVTILMNSFRIGVIGILVNEYGVEYAEGFLHYFEGWVIFISCTAILYVEAYILQRFFTKQKYSSVLNLDMEGVLSPLKRPGTSCKQGAAFCSNTHRADRPRLAKLSRQRSAGVDSNTVGNFPVADRGVERPDSPSGTVKPSVSWEPTIT